MAEGFIQKEYKSKYTDDIARILKKIEGLDFSYDPETDPLYEQAKAEQIYASKAEQDKTLARLSAPTRGIASTYVKAATAAVEKSYADKAAALIPSFEKSAYTKFKDEQNALSKQASFLLSLEKEDYKQYKSAEQLRLAAYKQSVQDAKDAAAADKAAVVTDNNKTKNEKNDDIKYSGKTIILND